MADVDSTQLELDRAQWDYDRAVIVRDQAMAAVNYKDQALAVAREKLEQAKRKAAEAIPVDRSARQLVSGGEPTTEDYREIKPESGQQKDYIVLTPAERAKGFVRPVRNSYRHLMCGAMTTIMSRDIAETYARDPSFYSGTFCVRCRCHFPVGEFIWCEADGREGPKVGT